MSAWEDARAMCEPPRGWAVDCYLGGPRPLQTGTPMDAALGGGLMPGVTVLGGEASVGKSALACHVAASVAARGGRVLYLTLDDSWGNVVGRCMSSWSVVHAREWGGRAFSWSALPSMRDRLRLSDATDLSRAAFEFRGQDDALAAWARWEDGPAVSLAVVDSVTDVGEVERMVAAMGDEGELPALIVVDYVQQWQSDVPETNRSEYSRVSDVAARLQRLSLWGGVPMLMLSSLRKLSKQERDDAPTLDWFRGSGVVGYSAWAACVLTRGERSGSGWREATLHVVKNKGGRAQTKHPVKVWGAYSYTERMEDG